MHSIRLLTLAHMDNKYLSIEKIGEEYLLAMSSFNKKFFQEVIIKKRILYLRRKNILLSIGLNNDRLEAEGIKKDHMKYGFLEDRKIKKQTYGIKKGVEKKIERKKEPFRAQKIIFPLKKEITVESEIESEIQPVEKKKEIKKKILPPVKIQLQEKKSPFHIESDSSNETKNLNISIENVKIVETGANRFFLKGIRTGNHETEDCLSFFQNKFTFLPCINGKNQIFKLVNHIEENIIAKKKENNNFHRKKFEPRFRHKHKRFKIKKEKFDVDNLPNIGQNEGNIFKEIYSTINEE